MAVASQGAAAACRARRLPGPAGRHAAVSITAVQEEVQQRGRPADKPQPGGQVSEGGQLPADLGARQNPAGGGRGGTTYSAIPIYVARPAVLRYLRISPATIAPVTDFLTVQAGQLVVTPLHLRERHPRAADPGPGLDLPAHLADNPLTAAQLAAARDVAAKAGLIIEAREEPRPHWPRSAPRRRLPGRCSPSASSR